MNKHLLLFIFLTTVFFESRAQKGNNSLCIDVEATIPMLQNDNGFGFYIKELYGIGKSAQLTLSGGYSKFDSKNTIGSDQVTTRLVPFLFGYKQNINKFFMEPKIGIGELGGRIMINGDYARPSIAALFGALSAGYTIKRISAGINFQIVQGIENNSAGIWYNKNFHSTSIFLIYDLLKRRYS